jgi:hypothetical protein
MNLLESEEPIEWSVSKPVPNMTSNRLIKLLACAAIVMAAACGGDDDPVEPDDGPDTVPDSVEFAKHVQPIFNSRCATSGCHVNPGPSADLVLTEGESYGNIVNVPTVVFTPGVRVTPFEPVNSVLYLLVESGTMPASGRRLSTVQVAIIRKWIEDGAPEN